ncbi:type IV pilin [Methanimicrococcus blatticola]|uniref:Flagellin-like protein n=1 Tax=Methanimicrococcus blatticola TaxID=91560 RepID=A0A484F6F0_9EURY|nr:type IV pilin N-terminal domain-containing protein [Methanimicrococcus blatticola]MBZ3934866.1 type IV pilin [Methanimicrococcus blatticola]MCC2509035.1 type IV pilin N-terminal domain-containing protein [Methanimicrococcus blatticola]TDQ70938.1 flagellin-like protein [Methanimicrococcus blatticola]
MKFQKTKKSISKFNFLSDNRGISPVVGVLLLLAITVVMAGYLATEVLSYEFTAPSQPVSLTARVENVTVGSVQYKAVRLEHSGGAPLQMSNIRILFNQSEADLSYYKNESFGIGESLLIGGIESSKSAVIMYPISSSTKKPTRDILKKGETVELTVIDSSNNQILFKKVIYV